MADKNRSIVIEHIDGSATLVENIPDNAKITFGPVQPGRGGYGSDNVLRIYTSASNQLAVFRDVRSFRDLSLTVKVREVETDTNTYELRGPNVNERSHSVSVRNGEFVQPAVPFN